MFHQIGKTSTIRRENFHPLGILRTKLWVPLKALEHHNKTMVLRGLRGASIVRGTTLSRTADAIFSSESSLYAINQKMSENTSGNVIEKM